MHNHPMTSHFTGAGTKLTLPERIQQGVYLYSGCSVPEYEPSFRVPPIDVLHPDLQLLMQEMFVDGHSNQAKRPLPAKWREVLGRVAADRKYVQRAEKILADHEDLLRQVFANGSNPASISVPAVTASSPRWKRRLIRGSLVAGVVAAVSVPAFMAYDRFVANRPAVPTPPPATYSAEEYGVGRPAPDLWQRLANED